MRPSTKPYCTGAPESAGGFGVGTHSARKVYAVDLMQKYGDIDRVRRAHALAVCELLRASRDARETGRVTHRTSMDAERLDIDNARDAFAWARTSGDVALAVELIVAAAAVHAMARRAGELAIAATLREARGQVDRPPYGHRRRHPRGDCLCVDHRGYLR